MNTNRSSMRRYDGIVAGCCALDGVGRGDVSRGGCVRRGGDVVDGGSVGMSDDAARRGNVVRIDHVVGRCRVVRGGRARRRGFTLIELLVVIAIMSGLMAILLPSLKKARHQAKNTQCLSRLKAIVVANTVYIDQEGKFPALNNDEDDGAWQFNYLIFDGEDWEQNFGPLVDETGIMPDVVQLFCPFQTDNHHILDSPFNPLPSPPSTPPVPQLSFRAGYGRRYHLSGMSLSQIHGTIAMAADLVHLPKVILSAHKTGVNAAYTDGHVQWVRDPGILTDNLLDQPFDPLDNPIMEDIWDVLDEAS